MLLKCLVQVKHVKKILTSHGVYVNYGILVRLAVHSDIDVYQINFVNAVQKFSRDNLSMVRNYDNYQNEFKVYQKENSNCSKKNCNGKIVKIFISNRSTFFCNNCQK